MHNSTQRKMRDKEKEKMQLERDKEICMYTYNSITDQLAEIEFTLLIICNGKPNDS